MHPRRRGAQPVEQQYGNAIRDRQRKLIVANHLADSFATKSHKIAFSASQKPASSARDRWRSRQRTPAASPADSWFP